MTPDDRRHGSWAGYQLGCREECCAEGARRYQAGRVYDAHVGRPRTVSSLGTRRRVQALACLGWSGYDIAERLGHTRGEWLRQVIIRDTIHRTTAERIARVYDELCMTRPLTNTHARRAAVVRTVRRAERNGWAPPLFWDDIDNPDEVPTSSTPDEPIDEVVLERLLSHHRTPSTRAEKCEAMRRWLDLGNSERSLCLAHGWKEGRYTPDSPITNDPTKGAAA